jgi:hypothetical protein
MESYLQLEKPPKEPFVHSLIPSVLAVIAVYFLVNAGSYFFPIIRPFDLSLFLYCAAALGLYSAAFQYGYTTTLGKSILYSVFYEVYYLYSLGADPHLFEKFKQIRNFYFIVFVVVY